LYLKYKMHLSSLSLHFNVRLFPGGYQNVSTLDFIGANDDGGGGNNWNLSRAKLQSKRHHQQTNTQFLQAECPSFLLPNQQCRSIEGEKYKIHLRILNTISNTCIWNTAWHCFWLCYLQNFFLGQHTDYLPGYLLLRLVGWLVFKGTFGTNRLYRAMAWAYNRYCVWYGILGFNVPLDTV